MSFLKDDKVLYKLLVDSGLINKAIYKYAQDAASVSDLAVKMIDNLRNSLSLMPTAPGSDEAEIYPRDLLTLGNFIAYLNRHKMYQDGLLVVVDAPKNPDASKYIQFESPFEKMQGMFRFVYKDGLIHLLNHLKEIADKNDDGIMRAMLIKLTEEANEKLKLKISMELDDTSTSDDLVLDKLPQELDLEKLKNLTESMLDETGDFELKARYFKTDNAKYLRNHYNITPSTICVFYNYLYNRALKKNNEFYINSVSSLAKDAGCTLSKISDSKPSDQKTIAPSKDTVLTNKDKQVGSNVSQEEDLEDKSITSLLSALPFIENGINLNRISYFMNATYDFLSEYNKLQKGGFGSLESIEAMERDIDSKISAWKANVSKYPVLLNGIQSYRSGDSARQTKLVSDHGEDVRLTYNNLGIMKGIVVDCISALETLKQTQVPRLIQNLDQQINLGNQHLRSITDDMYNLAASIRNGLGK